MKSDPHFIAERFTNPQYIEERTLSDRKVEIPQIRDNPDKRAEFIRDVIALANASRRRGEPGYLLFGIDNGWNIVGIEGQSVKKDLPPDYTPNDRHQIEKLQREIIEKAFNDIAREYIAPKAPLLAYHHNYYDELVEGKRVSYLEIRAESDNPIAYEVKKDIRDSAPPLHRGQAWERQGESKGITLSEQEKAQLYPWTRVPYISLAKLESYLNNLENQLTDTAEITSYQVLYSTSRAPLADEVVEFIASNRKLLVIKGPAGSGKTSFMESQARRLANDARQEATAGRSLGREELQNPIPIFRELKSLPVSSSLDGALLGRKIFRTLVGAKLMPLNYLPTELEKVFEAHNRRWLLFLDALDEVMTRNQKVWSVITELSESYPNIQVILTARTGSFKYSLPRSAKLVEVAPLSEQQIKQYLENRLTEEQFHKADEFFQLNPELQFHLQSPLFLSTAANYLSAGEVDEQLSNPLRPAIPKENGQVNLLPELIAIQSTETDLGTTQNLVREEVEEALKTDTEGWVDPAISLNSAASEEEPEPAPILLGVFLDRVFRRLWQHNEKKQLAGLRLGGQWETFMALGQMAANMAGQSEWQYAQAKKYVKKSGLCWILDLGILVETDRGVAFPTALAKAYFAANFLVSLLENDLKSVSKLVKNSADFWDKCLPIVKDLSPDPEMAKPLNQTIELLKGVK